MTAKRAALWLCPRCGRAFASQHQTHSCRTLRSLDDHFLRCEPAVRETFDAVRAAAQQLGPLTVLPEQTRIAFQVRMSFAAFMPRRHWLNGHLILATIIDSPRFTSVQVFSPRNVLHAFRLCSPIEVDPEFVGWLESAYAVGRQDHR